MHNLIGALFFQANILSVRLFELVPSTVIFYLQEYMHNCSHANLILKQEFQNLCSYYWDIDCLINHSLQAIFNRLIQMFYGVLFYNTCPNAFNITCLLSGGISNNLFNISSIFIRDRFWFLNFISNFSYFRFPCCFSCFMCYFLEAVSRVSSPVLVAVSNSFYPYLPVKFLGDDKNTYL